MKPLRIVLAACLLSGCQPAAPPAVSAADAMNDLADRYYAWILERRPEVAYFAAVALERHDGMFDNSPSALAEAQGIEEAFLAEVEAIEASELVGKPEWIARALLEQELRTAVAQRVCRQEFWNISQMGGWHSAYAQIAQLQPVGTIELNRQALDRWMQFPSFIDQEIDNLKAGVEHGYTVPKAVAERVIAQIDGLLALPVEDSPFYSPAIRDDAGSLDDPLHDLVESEINPALQRARDYLHDDYLAAARDELSITAIPNGAECYEAMLRGYTTLDRSGKDVYELGQATVAANRKGVIEFGRATYGSSDFAEILERAKNDPADHFESAEELLQFSQDMVARAANEMPDWVGKMPQQAVAVVPFEKHEEGTGRSAHYNPGNAGRPAEYRIPLARPEEASRGNAEATAFHETWPGHHLQVATFQAIDGLHPVTQIIWFSGPGEGWARYSEALAEEMGLYQSGSGPILRRAWPARGMVVDPGIHLFGWTREQARAFMLESGRFPESAGDEMVDRIAILPGQLTAYDSGGLEILALRRAAESQLGESFDIREFHDRVLENGTIPLTDLRQHVEAWIESRRAQ